MIFGKGSGSHMMFHPASPGSWCGTDLRASTPDSPEGTKVSPLTLRFSPASALPGRGAELPELPAAGSPLQIAVCQSTEPPGAPHRV